MDGYVQLLDRLFGMRGSSMYVFGERDEDEKLADLIEERASNPFAGLSPGKTIEAAAGFYPVLVVNWRFRAERNYTGREVHDMFVEVEQMACTTLHTFTTLRGAQDFHEHMLRIASQRTQVAEDLLRAAAQSNGKFFMPLRTGEHMATVCIASAPLPVPSA